MYHLYKIIESSTNPVANCRSQHTISNRSCVLMSLIILLTFYTLMMCIIALAVATACHCRHWYPFQTVELVYMNHHHSMLISHISNWWTFSKVYWKWLFDRKQQTISTFNQLRESVERYWSYKLVWLVSLYVFRS